MMTNILGLRVRAGSVLSYHAKRAFFFAARPAMAVSGALYRALWAPRAERAQGPVRAHLGPGRKAYLPGWINVDANAFTGKCDVWADLRHPLPFRDATLDAVYSHHVLEHLPDQALHFREVYRVLKPGGVYRVGGPNGDSAIRKFLEADISWFGDWPDRYESVGGRFNNFVFCRNEHLTLLTESFLREIAGRAGFVDVTLRLPVRETGRPDLFGDCLPTERESNFETPRTLIVECVR